MDDDMSGMKMTEEQGGIHISFSLGGKAHPCVSRWRWPSLLEVIIIKLEIYKSCESDGNPLVFLSRRWHPHLLEDGGGHPDLLETSLHLVLANNMGARSRRIPTAAWYIRCTRYQRVWNPKVTHPSPLRSRWPSLFCVIWRWPSSSPRDKDASRSGHQHGL